MFHLEFLFCKNSFIKVVDILVKKLLNTTTTTTTSNKRLVLACWLLKKDPPKTQILYDLPFPIIKSYNYQRFSHTYVVDILVRVSASYCRLRVGAYRSYHDISYCNKILSILPLFLRSNRPIDTLRSWIEPSGLAARPMMFEYPIEIYYRLWTKD